MNDDVIPLLAAAPLTEIVRDCSERGWGEGGLTSIGKFLTDTDYLKNVNVKNVNFGPQ